jgi:adenylate cyclase
MQRRLTTILAADIAGFSRLVGVDEEGTIAAVRAHRAELIEPLLKTHGGRIANTAGDSLLIEFASTVDAVRFALEMQDGMRARHEDVAADRRIEYRIGINLGDVIAEGDDLLGDGVNVAARLEALAPPGGIVLSRSVRDQVRDRLALELDDLGEVEVKNIRRPVRAFQVRRAGSPKVLPPSPPRRRRALIAAATLLVAVVAGTVAWYLGQPGVEPADPDRMAHPLPSGPSIAVLPFDEAGSGEDGLLGHGLAEDIARTLTEFRDLTVVSGGSSFDRSVPMAQISEELGVRYLLDGTIERSGERLRINAHLVDALSGRQPWAEQYEVAADDVFTVRDQVAGAIAARIGAKDGPLTAATLADASRKSSTDLDAYELLLLAQNLRHRFNREDNLRSTELLKRAIALDPQYARAYSDLAWNHVHAFWNGWADDPDKTEEAAIAAAERAIAIDPYFAGGYWVLGSVTFCSSGEPERAVELYRKALEINPNSPDIMAEWGFVLAQYLGRADEAVDVVQRAMRLNPRHADWYDVALATAHFYAREPEKAIAAARAIEYPTEWTKVMLAASYGHAGRAADAERQIAEIRADRPEFTLSTFSEGSEICAPGTSPDALAYLREGLEKAGLEA